MEDTGIVQDQTLNGSFQQQQQQQPQQPQQIHLQAPTQLIHIQPAPHRHNAQSLQLQLSQPQIHYCTTPQTNNITINQSLQSSQQPGPSTIIDSKNLVKINKPILTKASAEDQSGYKVKCDLLDYHLQEAILINKALREELKQYKEKINFEKKLQTFLIDRAKNLKP